MKNFTLLTSEVKKNLREEALDKANPSRVIDRVVRNHDWNTNPKRYTKQVTGWAKNNLLLDCWNQWLAYMEAIEKGFDPTAKGYESLGDMTRIEQVENFHAYLGGYLEGLRLAIEEDEGDE